jgi:hypothetical protein
LFIARPVAEDMPAYYRRYVDTLKETELLEALENTLANSLSLFASVGKGKENFRYAVDKWTVKEVVCHIADCERVFAYRALRFSRRDNTSLPGFNEGVSCKSSMNTKRSGSRAWSCSNT